MLDKHPIDTIGKQARVLVRLERVKRTNLAAMFAEPWMYEEVIHEEGDDGAAYGDDVGAKPSKGASLVVKPTSANEHP